MGQKNIGRLSQIAKSMKVLWIDACFLPTTSVIFEPDLILCRSNNNKLIVPIKVDNCTCSCHSENQLLSWVKLNWHKIISKDTVKHLNCDHVEVTLQSTPITYCWYCYAESRLNEMNWTEPHLLNLEFIIENYIFNYKNHYFINSLQLGLELYLINMLSKSLQYKYSLLKENTLFMCCNCYSEKKLVKSSPRKSHVVQSTKRKTTKK